MALKCTFSVSFRTVTILTHGSTVRLAKTAPTLMFGTDFCMKYKVQLLSEELEGTVSPATLLYFTAARSRFIS